jgi:hypothetical protein
MWIRRQALQDRIYGTLEIEDPVLLDVMQSAAMQRLRGVLQHGITGLIGITMPLSRFEHSVGVMLLVRQFGAPIDEQIAALLHDISHTAFSHVIDYVVGGWQDAESSYHERVKESYLASTDLPAILARHGYDWHDFLHEETYPLLEQSAPALCADRLDYFFRDCVDLKLGTIADCRAVVQALSVEPGRFVMTDPILARWLGDTYMAADHASWSDLREVGLYEVTAQAIRMGLELGVISEDDFWSTDQVVWDRLCASPNPDLQAQIRLVSAETQFERDDVAPHFRVTPKVRSIDPDILMHGELVPLSALDADYRQRREDYMRRKAGVWAIRVVAH